MDHAEPVTVYTLNNAVEAELVKNMLRDEGIHCFLNGIEQADNVGLPLDEIQVQVPAVYAERARDLLAARDRLHRPQ